MTYKRNNFAFLFFFFLSVPEFWRQNDRRRNKIILIFLRVISPRTHDPVLSSSSRIIIIIIIYNSTRSSCAVSRHGRHGAQQPFWRRATHGIHKSWLIIHRPRRTDVFCRLCASGWFTVIRRTDKRPCTVLCYRRYHRRRLLSRDKRKFRIIVFEKFLLFHRIRIIEYDTNNYYHVQQS